MAWVITYEAPKGSRVNRYFWAVTTHNTDTWFCHENKVWTNYEKVGKLGCSSHDHRPKTVKAFIRYLNKHTELKGIEVTLVNNFEGFKGENLSVTANWEE